MALVAHVEQERFEGAIGASDAAAILGLNDWESPISVWRRLRGEERKPPSKFQQDAMEFGQLFEPILRGKYAQMVKRAVFVPHVSTVIDGWLRATSDGIVLREGVAEPGTYSEANGDMTLAFAMANADGLLQCKTASAYKRDEWVRDGVEVVPPAYEAQVRTEASVYDVGWVDVFALVGQSFVGPIRITRDERLEHNILRDLWNFWNLVQSGREPPVDGSDGWREYVSGKMRPTDVELIADAEIDKLLGVWCELRKSAAVTKEHEELLKNDILLRLSAAGATKLVSNEHGKFSAYKTGASTKWREYALSLGGVAKPPPQFVRESTTWAVRAPRGFGGGDGDE